MIFLLKNNKIFALKNILKVLKLNKNILIKYIKYNSPK